MRSKFFVRAVKRGDYDPRNGCGCELCEGDDDDWNHKSGLFVKNMVSYTWGPRGEGHWPKSRQAPEILTRKIYRDGQLWYQWIPAEQLRAMKTEYSRRRKKR